MGSALQSAVNQQFFLCVFFFFFTILRLFRTVNQQQLDDYLLYKAELLLTVWKYVIMGFLVQRPSKWAQWHVDVRDLSLHLFPFHVFSISTRRGEDRCPNLPLRVTFIAFIKECHNRRNTSYKTSLYWQWIISYLLPNEITILLWTLNRDEVGINDNW